MVGKQITSWEKHTFSADDIQSHALLHTEVVRFFLTRSTSHTSIHNPLTENLVKGKNKITKLILQGQAYRYFTFVSLRMILETVISL